MYHGWILDPDKAEGDAVIDEGMCVYMRSPRSYTREDVVEIQAHAGPAILRAILELILRMGARLADPGEFTRRAFLNGRIDLTQAEAVADRINAQGEAALRMAAAHAEGKLRERIAAIRSELLAILTETEAAIDFPEEVGEAIDAFAIREQMRAAAIEPLEKLQALRETGRILRDGLRIVLVGRPNVGKSSLMNRLLDSERAIVTEIPGTTRDTLEAPMVMRGIPVHLIDTAGIHETEDPIETLGIDRSRQSIATADILLFLTDAGEPLTKADFDIFHQIDPEKTIWVSNKSDLVESAVADLDLIPEAWEKLPSVAVSAKYDMGIDILTQMIVDSALKGMVSMESHVVPNLRQSAGIEAALGSLFQAEAGIDENAPFELVNIDIREALDRLGEVIGVTVHEDLLDEIFSNFCIGK